MSSEYIKLSLPEVLSSEKNLLHAELELLQIIKHYRSYQEFRKEESILKLALKKKTKEIKESLGNLERSLPKAKLPKNKPQDKKEEKEINSEVRANPTLESEISDIQERLASLGA